MKKLIIVLSLLVAVPVFVLGQKTDPFVSKCAMNTGPNTTYLKDFIIKLPKEGAKTDLRQKQLFPLSKNMKYRFTLCNADNSTGQLIMKIKDDQGKLILSSYDSKSGKAYASVDFQCNKSGTYQISFDFVDYQQGLGVGIVSLVK